MRLNKFLASSTVLSRRAADEAIASGRITINGHPATLGVTVAADDTVCLDGRPVSLPAQMVTIIFHKPAGYVVSRNGQGAPTIYSLLPEQYQQLNPVGRLDKDSSGLLLLTNDGRLAQELTHPKYHKQKQYEVQLDTPLQPLHRQLISDTGITLEDGQSKLGLARLMDDDDRSWVVTMHEGRNRQIRRTFAALGYTVTVLHRTQFGPYRLDSLKPGESQQV